MHRPSSRHRPRILLVDDEFGFRRTLVMALRAEGYQVDDAADGPEALNRLNQHSYDLALVDLMLPGIHGLDLARQLRQLHPEVKVVLVSAYHLSKQQLAQADCGAVGFIPKPCPVSELVSFLRGKLPPDAPAAGPP